MDRRAGVRARRRRARPTPRRTPTRSIVDLDGKAPYDRASLDRLVEKLDGQMAAHRARNFAEKAKVLDYFQKSRDILLKIREAGGLPAERSARRLARRREPRRLRPRPRGRTPTTS